MQSLAIQVQKGGVGKSLIACQLAFHFFKNDLKILFIDADDQSNAFDCLHESGIFKQLDKSLTDIFLGDLPHLEEMGSCILRSDKRITTEFVEQALRKIQTEEQETDLASFGFENFKNFLSQASAFFDVVVVDCPPSNDLRVPVILSSMNFVLVPFVLAKESITGMFETLHGQRGITHISNEINPNLQFLGFLPNRVESSKTQQEGFKEVVENFGDMLFRNTDGSFGKIPNRALYSRAQAASAHISDFAKATKSGKEVCLPLLQVLDSIQAKIFNQENSITEGSFA